MRAIWKFPLQVTDKQAIMMPIGADILTVQIQNDQPFLWAVCETSNEQRFREVITCGTGNQMSAVGRYIGTYQFMQGALVLHVFEAP